MNVNRAKNIATKGPLKTNPDMPSILLGEDGHQMADVNGGKSSFSAFLNLDKNTVNAALLAHWYNAGPKLLEALSATLQCRDCTRIADGIGCKGCPVSEKFNTATNEAEEVEGI